MAVSIRCLPTSRCRHLEEEIRTMAHITFGHRAEHTPPTTMDHPGQWHYVVTRLMAHVGAYSPDELNGLHWQWHQRAALRIRMAMQRHNIWAIPGSLGYRGHTSGDRRPRSQEVLEPPRQAARRKSPGGHHGPPPGVGSPSATYRSPLGPFAPRRDQGSPHNPGVQGGTPKGHQETRSPGCSRHRSRTPPPAARRVVFHEGMDRGHGGPNDSNAQPTSSVTDSRRWSKRPAPNGRTSPPFPRQLSESNRQRSTQTPTRQQTESPTRPLPPSQSRQPARCQGDSAPRTHGQGHSGPTNGQNMGWGDKPLNASPRERGAMTPVTDTGTGHPTNWAHTPRGSPPQLQYSQTAGARRSHRDNGSTTRAARERTKK